MCRERGRARIPSRFCSISTEPHSGFSLTSREIMTWAQNKNWMLNRLSHPRCPTFTFLDSALWRRKVLFFFLMFIYFWETEWEQGSSREGGRHRIWSTEAYVGLEPMNHEIMTWAKVGRLTCWATQVPRNTKVFNFYDVYFRFFSFIAQVISKKPLPDPKLCRFTCMFPSKSL